jgi:regulation of enolase protein 1 (concanavalin A-like superfamily)
MNSILLDETFKNETLSPQLTWLNPPPVFRTGPSGLYLETAANTDFWRRTHYGFEADNGHFLYANITGDFILTTQVSFIPANQYDQAGLMVRLSPANWLKTSVEYESHIPPRLGAVVTNLGFSDWSTQAFPVGLNEIRLRIRRESSDYIIEAFITEAGADHLTWSQLRMAHLHTDDGQQTVQCGIYSCSPIAAGYKVVFSQLKIEAGRLSKES